MSTSVELAFAVPVTTVSYVPSTHYPGTNVIYEGPWLLDGDGSGVLTFHGVEVSVGSSVGGSVAGSVGGSVGVVLQHDEALPGYVARMLSPTEQFDDDVLVSDLHGRTFTSSITRLAHLAVGAYIVRTPTSFVRILVTP
jgi:hypothetical protein